MAAARGAAARPAIILGACPIAAAPAVAAAAAHPNLYVMAASNPERFTSHQCGGDLCPSPGEQPLKRALRQVHVGGALLLGQALHVLETQRLQFVNRQLNHRVGPGRPMSWCKPGGSRLDLYPAGLGGTGHRTISNSISGIYPKPMMNPAPPPVKGKSRVCSMVCSHTAPEGAPVPHPPATSAHGCAHSCPPHGCESARRAAQTCTPRPAGS